MKLVKNSFVYRCKTPTREKRFIDFSLKENTPSKDLSFFENKDNFNISSQQFDYDPFVDYINSIAKKSDTKKSSINSNLNDLMSNDTVFNVTCDFVPKEKAPIYDSEAHR